MNRLSTAIPVAALLLLAAATSAFSDANAGLSRRHSPGPDGVWNKIYFYPGGVGNLEPVGTAFDPSREQLIQFQHGGVWFRSVAPPNEDHFVAIRDWAGTPVACSAIYDPRRDQIVVLTLDSLSNTVGTFALPLRDPVKWNRVVPFGASPNVSYASGIYDPVGDRMIVYGGVDFSKGRDAVGEVWSLSLGHRSRWTRIEARGPVPPARMEHTAVYDSERGAMVVYGGREGMDGAILGDVWTLDLATRPRWRRVTTDGAAPANRTGHASTYDARWHRMIVMGGRSSASLAANDAFHDLWALSLRGDLQWRLLNPTGVAPGAFGRPLAFADASQDRMLVTNYAGALAFLWAIDWKADLRASDSSTDFEEPLGVTAPVSSDANEFAVSLPSQVWHGGALVARVTLAESAPASLSLFDAAGRRVWTVDRSALGVGVHQIAITPDAALPTGVYFLRLQQGEKSQTAKVLTLR